MRRKDREITHIHTILDLVSECKVCRLAMTDGGVPYIVPLNYGYEDAAGASWLKTRTPAPMATPLPAS